MNSKSKFISTPKFKVCALALAVGQVAAYSSSTLAEAAADAWMLEEVVVTARKRSETLQDIPSSVQAMGGDALENMGANGFEDFAGFTPGVELAQRGKEMTQIDMRGVTMGMVDRDQPELRETVGLYLGETPIAVQGFNPNLSLYDLERVEILRGPQPTLYGAGSLSGTIRLIPNAPSMDGFEFKGDVSVSDVDNGELGQAYNVAVNVPLSDMAAVRAVGFYRDEAGYIDNAITGDDDVNSGEEWGGRVALRLELTEKLSIDTTLLYSDMDYNGLSHVVDGFVSGLPSALPAGVDPQASDYEQYSPSNGEGWGDETLISSVVINYDFEAATLTSVTSYMDKEFIVGYEIGGADDFFYGGDDAAVKPLAGLPAEDGFAVYVSDLNVEQFAQEFRLASSGDGPLLWTLGLYYENRQMSKDEFYYQPGIDSELTTVYGAFGLLDAFGLPSMDATIFGANTDELFRGARVIDTEQLAVFAEATYEISEKWEVTAGLRWYDAEAEQTTVFGGAFLFTPGGTGDLVAEADEDGVNPTVNVAYQVDEDRLIYATVSRGFRLGGTNVPAPAALCSAEMTSLELDPNVLDQPFDADNLWNYEIGARTSWMDGRLTVNAAAYYIDWQDPQVPLKLGCGFPVYVNGPDMEVKGFEMDLAAAVSENLSARIGAGYTNSTITDDHTSLQAQDGDKAPNTPDFTFSAAFDYSRPLGEGMELIAHADYRWTDDRYTRFESNPNGNELDSYGVANGSVGLLFEDAYEVHLFVNNLANEEVVTYVHNQNFAEHAQRQASVLRPRTVGIRFATEF